MSADDMDGRARLATLTVPWGGQEIELQELTYDDTGVSCASLEAGVFSPRVSGTGSMNAGLAEPATDAGACDRPTAKLLRVRIREGRRFTIFDIDAVTARAWAAAMADWAERQLEAARETDGERSGDGRQ